MTLHHKSALNLASMLGLRTTIYKVNELDKAREWYSEAFRTKPYFDEEFYVGFNIGGFELGLLPDPENDAPKGANVLSYWGVNDIEESYAHLLKLGAVTHEAPNNVGGEIMVATVFDPWQNLIGIIFNPHFVIS